MIRHRPFGSGHPYEIDTEQRSPAVPVAGLPLTLGVRSSPEVTDVTLELVLDDGDIQRIPLGRTRRASRGQLVDDGHLSAAQERSATATGWSTTIAETDADRARYRFTSPGQSTRWFDVAFSRWIDADDAVDAVGSSRVIPGSISVLRHSEGIERVRFALVLLPDERVLGLGERFESTEHRGSAIDAVVFEQYKNQAQKKVTYLPMPFAHVVGGAGWGFHVRTSTRVWFDIARSQADRIWVEVDRVVESPSPLSVAFYDGTPRHVLGAFLDEVGRAEVLPDWIFRLWASSNEWNTQAEVLRQSHLHEEHGIPVGAIVIEAWSDESTFTIWRDAEYLQRDDGGPMQLHDFSFPADGAWPDPVAMVRELHEHDTRVLLWQIPLIKTRPHPRGQVAADAAAATSANALIREPSARRALRPYRNRGWWFPLSLMPDLTSPEVAEWWTAKRRYLVEEVGIDGFKTDGGEHAWGNELVYRDGARGATKNNLFPVAYAKAYGDLLRSAGKAPITFSRAGFTGSQAHGTFWAGDENSTWEAFRWSLNAGLSAAASGIVYWGWDFAGFSGDVPGPELYLRSAAAAAFVPIMQYHSEFNFHRRPLRDRTPWNIQERSGDERVIPVFRRIVEVRERMVGYLAREAERAVESSAPLMRPLWFEWPDAAGVWSYPQQWLLGDDLLVAPVTQPGVDSWEIYLPPGEWVDAWTGELVHGDRVVSRQVPIGEIPVYSRRSAWPGLKQIFA